MDKERFSALVTEEFAHVPSRFRARLKNVAFLIEDEPDPQTHAEEALSKGETLLGLYRGTPANARGEGYGIGATVPDTITLYRRPILALATRESGEDPPPESAVRYVIYETLWHEIGHALGLSEEQVRKRERERTNFFRES